MNNKYQQSLASEENIYYHRHSKGTDIKKIGIKQRKTVTVEAIIHLDLKTPSQLYDLNRTLTLPFVIGKVITLKRVTFTNTMQTR